MYPTCGGVAQWVEQLVDLSLRDTGKKPKSKPKSKYPPVAA